jgi:hypothetical protein
MLYFSEYLICASNGYFRANKLNIDRVGCSLVTNDATARRGVIRLYNTSGSDIPTHWILDCDQFM